MGHETRTVLIVDDDLDTLDSLSDILESSDYKVIKTPDGSEALNILKNQIPDVILLDIMLPGIDGYTLCEEIRKKEDLTNIPIIMITARSKPGDIDSGYKSGANDYLIKPFSTKVLINAIDKQIRKQEKNEIVDDVIENPQNLEEVIKKIDHALASAEALRYINPLLGVLGERFTKEGLEYLGRELAMAKDIQRDILPYEEIDIEGYKTSYQIEMGSIVSGDFYDFGKLKNGNYWGLLGDVVGHGIPAAILMVMVRSVIRTIMDIYCDGEEIIRILNKRMFEDTMEFSFVALAMFIIDNKKNDFVLYNNGIPYPIYFNKENNSAEFLKTDGMVIGSLEEITFTPYPINMKSGDVILLYTDGLIGSGCKDFFISDEELKKLFLEIIASYPFENAGSILLERITKLSGFKKYDDDIAIILLKKK